MHSYEKHRRSASGSLEVVPEEGHAGSGGHGPVSASVLVSVSALKLFLQVVVWRCVHVAQRRGAGADVLWVWRS